MFKLKNQSEKPMSAFEKFIFCFADVFGGGAQSIVSVLYLIFLTNIIGVNPVWAGTVVMISKMWDAISDPLMGVISDNTRFSWGRRKPYICVGGALFFIALALLWLPIAFENQIGKIVYVSVTYIFYSTVCTIIAVPYSSMSTEITTDFEQRSKLNMLRLVFSLVATAVATLVPTFLFESLTKNEISVWGFYSILVFGFGILFCAPLILIGFVTHERAVFNQKRAKFDITQFIKPFKVKAFLKLLVLYLSQSITLDIVSAVILYYSLYVVAGLGSTVFLGTFLGVQLLMFPFINSKINKISKSRIYYFGLPLSIICAAGIAFYPSDMPIIGLYIITALTALGFAGAQTMCWNIFPDVVDIGQLGLNEQITGSFSGVMTFVRKASSAIAIFIIGNILQFTGFIAPSDAVPVPQQPPQAVLGIRLIILFTFLILMGTAYFVAKNFKLTPQLSKRVKYFITVQAEGRLGELSAEETNEYNAIINEFVR